MSFYQEEEQEQEEEQDQSMWGFFVEIDLRDEHRYYNKRTNFITLDTIEEEYNYDLDLDLEIEQSCFPFTKPKPKPKTNANKTSCFNTFIPYLCILATLIYLQVL